MTDLDIWRSANLLLKRYGGEAVFIATRRADSLLDLGDPDGCGAWVRIAKACFFKTDSAAAAFGS